MKRWWLKPAIPVVSFWLIHLTSGMALAQENGHGGAKQPGIFDPRQLDLGIWTIVVFVVLFLVLRKYAWGPMLEGLHKREERIEGAIAEAQRRLEDAERARAQFQAQLDRAQEEVRNILDEARRTAQRATDEMVAKARAEIQTERERLRREIEMARDQALQELWSQTAQLATLISAKAIRRQLNKDDHRRLVDEAIAELGKPVHRL